MKKKCGTINSLRVGGEPSNGQTRSNSTQLGGGKSPHRRPAPKCPYCENPSVLVTGDTIYPLRSDLRHKLFWLCRPCDAYVGCHPIGNGDGTKPLGRLADAPLRKAKMSVHAALDPLWKDGLLTRRMAYHHLAVKLGIPPKECHIGWFDIRTCERAVEVCKELQQLFE